MSGYKTQIQQVMLTSSFLMKNVRLKSSCTWTSQTTYSLRLDGKNTTWQMRALLREKSILACSDFAPHQSCAVQPHWKVQNLSCNVADWYLLHEVMAWATLSALQSPWASLLETPPIASPKISILTYATSYLSMRPHTINKWFISHFLETLKLQCRLCHYHLL